MLFCLQDVRRCSRCCYPRVSDREGADPLVQTRVNDSAARGHRPPVTKVDRRVDSRATAHLPTAELAEQFLTWRHRPDVTTSFLQQRIEDPAEYVADWATYTDHDHHRVVSVLDGVMVGQATLGVVDGMGQSGHEAEFMGHEGRLSYFVHPDHAGQGVAMVLGDEALANALGRLGLRRVQAGCFADNVASCRVLENPEMRREQHGVKDSFHAELGWLGGYVYAVLAEEWRE